METKKEKMHPIYKMLIILFIIFIAFYISLESGYYPSKIKKDTVLTNKEISKFENEVKEGNIINEKGYINEKENYSNFVTKTGNLLTKSVGKILVEVSNGIKEVFKYLFW